jgi:hypothetical protein
MNGVTPLVGLAFSATVASRLRPSPFAGEGNVTTLASSAIGASIRVARGLEQVLQKAPMAGERRAGDFDGNDDVGC